MKNPKIIVFSIVALICMILVYAVDWLFIIPAIILVILSQKELIKKREK